MCENTLQNFPNLKFTSGVADFAKWPGPTARLVLTIGTKIFQNCHHACAQAATVLAQFSSGLARES